MMPLITHMHARAKGPNPRNPGHGQPPAYLNWQNMSTKPRAKQAALKERLLLSSDSGSSYLSAASPGSKSLNEHMA